METGPGAVAFHFRWETEMINATSQRILHDIAGHINGMDHNPSKGGDQNPYRAEVLNTDGHIGEELLVHGEFPGIPSRFAVPYVLWFIVEDDSLLMCARIIPEQEDTWQETWVLDRNDSISVLEDEDFMLLEQSMATFSKFLTAFDTSKYRGAVSVAVASLTDFYLLTLNEQGVERQFDLNDPQMCDQLHAHLVTLGMQHLPPFPVLPHQLAVSSGHDQHS